jgi:hypothetical protein
MVIRVFRETPDRGFPTSVVGEVRLSVTTGINALNIAIINLYTVPAGDTVVVTRAEVRCTAVGISPITVAATAGIGIAAGEDDIFNSQLLNGLTTSGKVFKFPVGGIGVIAAAGEIINLGIDIGATTSFGSQTFEVDLFGYSVE